MTPRWSGNISTTPARRRRTIPTPRTPARGGNGRERRTEKWWENGVSRKKNPSQLKQEKINFGHSFFHLFLGFSGFLHAGCRHWSGIGPGHHWRVSLFFNCLERLFLDKNKNRTFLHALLMGPEGIKMTFFCTRGLPPSVKKCHFYAWGHQLKVWVQKSPI